MMQNNNHLEKEAAEYFADIFSAPAGYPISDQTIDVSAYEDLDINETTYDPREDLDYNDFMNSLVDPITGTLRDFRIDDRSLPAAVNFYDYCLNINKGELNIPWARQLIALESFLGEICPYCSNKKYLDPLEVPKDFPPEDLKNPKRLVFLENGVCPICGRTKKHIYHENKFPRYTQGVVVWGQRSGKSSSAASIASYTLHRYLKYPMLAELAPRMMQKSTQLTGIFCSLTFKKAVDVLWIPFRNIILTSEWFNNYFELLEDYKRKTGIKLLINSTTKLAIGNKNMLCFPTGPRASTLRGNTSFMCYLDELGLFPMPKKEEDDDVNRQASPDEAYTSLFNSLVTVTSTADALVEKGYYSVPPSFILSVSSPVSSRDKVMRLLKDAEKDPSIFTSHLPSWEVNPGLWRNKGMIASAFIKDPEKAMRDYGAQPSDIAFGYFNFEDCVKLFTGSPLTHTFKQRVIDDELFCTLTKVSSVPYPCVMALDAGLVNNSFSVVVIYYDIQQDKIKTAAIVECMPVKGKTINFAKMYEHVILPLAKDLNVCYVCADRWNSIDLLHRLKHDMGNNPKGKPFTRADTYTLKKKDFEAFKLAIANQSLVLPKLRENEIEEIRQGITGDYRKAMYGRPVNHLLLQMATVIDAGTNMCPEKGPSFTDDILRAYVLAVTRLQTEKVSQRLIEFKDYIKTSDPNQAMFVPIVVGRMGLG